MQRPRQLHTRFEVAHSAMNIQRAQLVHDVTWNRDARSKAKYYQFTCDQKSDTQGKMDRKDRNQLRGLTKIYVDVTRISKPRGYQGVGCRRKERPVRLMILSVSLLKNLILLPGL